MINNVTFIIHMYVYKYIRLYLQNDDEKKIVQQKLKNKIKLSTETDNNNKNKRR